MHLKTYTAATAPEILDPIIVPVWEDSHRQLIHDDPFYSTVRFLERFRGYSRAPGFGLCIATSDDGEPLGVTFGYTLQPGARWWNGLLTDVPEGFTDEDGQRTFAINEIMVVEAARRRGIATALHRHLLADRTEKRATLLVNPTNVAARSAYLSWGWQPVATLKPFPDSPTYESMIVTLPPPATA